MVEPLRHRQSKEAATDMFSLQPPRHISTLYPSRLVALGSLTVAFGAKRTLVGRPPQRIL